MNKNEKKGFTLIELMIVIVIIGVLVAIALPNFSSTQDRAKIASVKSNMHSSQIIFETYKIDWGGVFPNDFNQANLEATNENYWKSFSNPFSGKTGENESYIGSSLTSESDFIKSGMVGYEGVVEQGIITKYYIYGSPKEKGVYIKDKNKAYYLSNE